MLKLLEYVLPIAGRLSGGRYVVCRGCSSVSQPRTEDTAGENGGEVTAARRHSRLRQMALLVAYSGDRYYGMELLRNSGFPTVEEQLFEALRRSGAVADSRAAFPPHYSRASRTDRGVSALGQVVSLRMRVWDGVLDDINCHLPADIRVCGMRRVPPRFNAQTLCDNRLYSYTLPTLAFTPLMKTVTLDYRLPEFRRREVHQMFQQYVGVHSFHSFSPQGDPNSQQMVRRVLSVEVAEPYLAEGLEFTTIWIRGGSFVLSQIRRMIGLVLAVCRGSAGKDGIRDALRHQRLTGVTAPGLGLILRQATFETFASAPWNAHGPLQWSDEAAAAAARLGHGLLQRIHTTEAAQLVTFQFIGNLLHNRVGWKVTGVSSFRSPLGYALVKVSDLESVMDSTGATKVTPDVTEVTEVTPGPAEVAEIAPSLVEIINISPVPAEVTEVTPDPAEVTEVTIDKAEVIEITSDPAEVAKFTSDPAEVAKFTPDPAEVTEVTPDPAEITEVTPDPAEITEVTPDPAEVAKFTPDPAEVTEVTPDPAEVREVTEPDTGDRGLVEPHKGR